MKTAEKWLKHGSSNGEAPAPLPYGAANEIKQRAREVSKRLDERLMARVKFTPNPNYKGPK